MPRGFEGFLQGGWPGEAWRHIRDYDGADVLDFTHSATATDNRWNHAGEPTLYLASDINVAMGEYSRHLRLNRDPLGAPRATTRRFYLLDLQVEPVLDLRDPQLCEALQVEDEDGGVRWFFDKSRSRAVGAYLRHVTDARGLIAPAMAALDDPERWNLVVFLEKLPGDPRSFFSVRETFAATIRPD